MIVTFKGQHIAIPESIKEHALRRTSRFDRVLPESTELLVELRREDTRSAEERFIAQVTLSQSGSILRAEERARDIEAAVDAAVDVLDRRVRRFKQRRQQRDRTTLARDSAEVAEAIEAPDEDSAEAAEFRLGRVVRVKRFLMKPMSLNEAVEQAELLGHAFFLFFSAEDNQYAVLYRRSDQSFGLIVPEEE